MKTVGVFGIVLLAVLSQGDCRANHALENRALTENPVGGVGTILLDLIFALFGDGSLAGMPEFPRILQYMVATLFNNGIAGVNPVNIFATLFALFTMNEVAQKFFIGFTTIIGAVFGALGGATAP